MRTTGDDFGAFIFTRKLINIEIISLNKITIFEAILAKKFVFLMIPIEI